MGALVSVVSAACLSACGGGSEEAEGRQTYTDPAYGYSFEYDEQFTVNPAAHLSVTTGGNTVSSVSALDGSANPGEPVTAFNVSAYELGRSATLAQPSELSKSVKEDVLSKLSNEKKGIAFQELVSTQVADRPGFTTEGEFTVANEKWRTRLYFVVDGNIEYQLTTQAPAADWENRKTDLKKIVDSFTTATANKPVTPSPVPEAVGSYSGANADFCNVHTDLVRAYESYGIAQIVDNQASVTAAREVLSASLRKALETLPADAPGNVRDSLETVSKQIASQSQSEAGSTVGADVDGIGDYAKRVCQD